MSRKNIVIFGETGSGKSSVVNLLLGHDQANVSDKAVGCTFSSKRYDWGNYALYDTVGLSEGKHGTVTSASALRQLVNLLKSLSDGVSLLIYVIKKDRIRETTEKNYKLFVNDICMSEVPVLLVITNCEMEPVVGTWWGKNKEYFDKYGMRFQQVISGCAATPGDVHPAMQPVISQVRTETRGKLEQAIRQWSLQTPWRMPSWTSWLARVFTSVWNTICSFFGFSDGKITLIPRLTEILMSYGMNRDAAVEAANEIAASQ